MLEEMHIIVGVMDMAKRFQDVHGLTRKQAMIATRTLLFVLEEVPDTFAEAAAKGEQLGPLLHKFIQQEIEEIHAHDRES
jgi:hypothetical protein